ncbi:MarR family winged helix-turn-helix transcriptional regulator [Streptomyces althioticus]|uniref:MarR family winged helix-turn-helix transcriptional regulator n=1 Tax=Streptomyces althioticus TaxID=83380 RepID=UPI00368E215F
MEVSVIPSTPSDQVTLWWRQARPDLDTHSMDVFGRLRRLQVLVELEASTTLAGVQLTSSELDVMVTLRHADTPLIARNIAALRGCSRAAMSNILAKMEKRGLVVREPNPADRRAVLVRLTDAGEQLTDTVFPKRLSLEADLLSQLSEAEQHQVAEALDLLVNAMLRRSPLPPDPEAV